MNRKIIGIFLESIKRYKYKLALIVFTFVLASLFSFLNPYIVKNIMDQGMANKDFRYICMLSLLLLLVYVCQQIINLFQAKLSIEVKNQFINDLMGKSFAKLMRLKLEYFNKNNTTEIVRRLYHDAEMAGLIVDRNMISVLSYAVCMVSGCVGLILLNWKLSILVFLFVPIKSIIIYHMTIRNERLEREVIVKTSDFSSWFGNIINGIREVKLWNLYSVKGEEYRCKQQQILAIDKKREMVNTYNICGDSMVNAILTVLLYTGGGWLVSNGRLSIGGLVAFLAYSLSVTGPITSIMNLRYFFSSITPSIERMCDFFELEEELSGNEIIGNNEFRNLTLENVTYAYGENKVIKNLNLKIERGDKIAIVGQNGVGKTTLIQLLLGFIRPADGNICINGKEIGDIRLNDYRELFSIVSQNVYMFKDSVIHNLDLKNECDLEEIMLVCKKNGVDDVICNLPTGYHSLLEENGANLSGGERQKLALIRAVLKKGEILIMDEPTSQYDAVSADTFMNRIINEYKEKTMIIITHDNRVLDKVDKIYTLEKGRLAALS
ncbi:MAG: transporter ATP-binding protein [Herbinix sp.]|nr:transporter ATP-binding protein [Herbinix sp.]